MGWSGTCSGGLLISHAALAQTMTKPVKPRRDSTAAHVRETRMLGYVGRRCCFGWEWSTATCPARPRNTSPENSLHCTVPSASGVQNRPPAVPRALPMWTGPANGAPATDRIAPAPRVHYLGTVPGPTTPAPSR
jgi:hypothetical protein